MRRLLIWLPMLLTACTGNFMGPEASLGGPLGRFGHSLSLQPATPAPVLATRAPEIAALPVQTPAPRQLVATPRPFAPEPVRPTPSPTPAPTATPEVTAVLLEPEPVPLPSTTLTQVVLNQRTLTFIVWDDATEDGDRIRLYVNGTIIEAASDLTLSSMGKRLTVTLNSGVNEIRFMALNEGEYGLNTFAFQIDRDLMVEGLSYQQSRGLSTGESETLTVLAP